MLLPKSIQLEVIMVSQSSKYSTQCLYKQTQKAFTSTRGKDHVTTIILFLDMILN